MIERMCQGCKTVKDRDLMIKITKLGSGLLKINPKSSELGRSVYVCKNFGCVKNLIKKRKLKTALKCSNFKEIEKIESELLKLVENDKIKS